MWYTQKQLDIFFQKDKNQFYIPLGQYSTQELEHLHRVGVLRECHSAEDEVSLKLKQDHLSQ